jgi:hypothetical protein
MDKLKHVLSLHENVPKVINIISYNSHSTDSDYVRDIEHVTPNKRLRSRRYRDEHMNGYVKSTCITDTKTSYHDLLTYELIEDSVYVQIRKKADPLCIPDVTRYDYVQCYDIITLKQNDGTVVDEITYYDDTFNTIKSVIKRKRQTITNINDVVDTLIN